MRGLCRALCSFSFNSTFMQARSVYTPPLRLQTHTTAGTRSKSFGSSIRGQTFSQSRATSSPTRWLKTMSSTPGFQRCITSTFSALQIFQGACQVDWVRRAAFLLLLHVAHFEAIYNRDFRCLSVCVCVAVLKADCVEYDSVRLLASG
jgi:hypothetical protein